VIVCAAVLSRQNTGDFFVLCVLKLAYIVLELSLLQALLLSSLLAAFLTDEAVLQVASQLLGKSPRVNLLHYFHVKFCGG